MLRDTIAQCKLRLPMPELWARLGLSVPRNFKSFCSPFREDSSPSASVFQIGQLWFYKDHATSESFDEIGLIQRHTGCDKTEAIKSYHELAGVELEGRSKKEEFRKGRFANSRVVAIYDYLDAEGTLAHQTLRWEPKDFSQRRPAAPGMHCGKYRSWRDPKGNWWISTLDGIEPVLYRLPQLVADPDKTVVICEGEKDADALAQCEPDVCATTAPMGAGKWRDSYTEFLAGRDVIIAGHNDLAGAKHNLTVAEKLLPSSKSVRVVKWEKLCASREELPQGFDISDYLAGVTLECTA